MRQTAHGTLPSAVTINGGYLGGTGTVGGSEAAGALWPLRPWLWHGRPALQPASVAVRHEFTGRAATTTSALEGATGIALAITGVERAHGGACRRRDPTGFDERASFRASYEGAFAPGYDPAPAARPDPHQALNLALLGPDGTPETGATLTKD